MHIHILGIAGTFMGSLALIAKQLGHTVTGMDEGVYPPMSTQLDEQNINYTQGYRFAKSRYLYYWQRPIAWQRLC